jgi:hypothetical protein
MSQDPWQALLLLGTARAAAPLPPPPHPLLASTWQQLASAPRELAVLHAAALLAAARGAGALPMRTPELAPACPPDPAPVWPAPAAERVRRMLAGEQAACLREGLQLAAAHGLRSTARDLPALLDRGRTEVALRQAIGAVLGERGRWLARSEPHWQWALGTAMALPDSVWHEGAIHERQAWLRQRHDSDPAAAAAALAATWADEAGEARELLLAAIVQPPHPAAAAWLERCALRDRRGAVRALARSALLRLPDTPLRARAVARATPLLRVEGRGAQRRVVLTLPAAFEPDWQADGIDEKPPKGTGPRAHWARQLLAMVPLQHWLDTFGCDGEQWFQWNRDDDSRDVLRLCAVDAIVLGASPALAVAFTRALLLGDQWPVPAGDRRTFVREWLAALPGQAAAAVLAELAGRFPGDELFGELLLSQGAVDAGDPAAIADGLLQWLQRGRLTREQAAQLGAATPRAAIPRLLQTIAAMPDLPGVVEVFANTLDFRQTLLTAFAGPTKP